MGEMRAERAAGGDRRHGGRGPPDPSALLASRPVGEGVYSVVVPAAESRRPRAPPTLEEFRRQLRAFAGHRFRRALPALVVPLRGRHPAGRAVPGRAGAAGRRRGAHPSAASAGKGLNLGVQDAFNLGWKLAAQIRGWAPDTLLDTYQAERHPVAADVLDNTRAQMELSSAEPGAAGRAQAAHRADGLR